MKNTMPLIKEYVKEKLNDNVVARDVITCLLDYETIVQEESILLRTKKEMEILL